MKNRNLILLFLTFIKCFNTVQSASACGIGDCVECSVNLCSKCDSGFKPSYDQKSCQQSDSAESSNVGLIVSVSISGFVFLGLVFCIWRKCKDSSSKESINTNKLPETAFSPPFSCMGMSIGDPLECNFMMRTTSYSDSQCQNDYLYPNRFNQNRAIDPPFKNDCDRMAFKLDRKQNIFPKWEESEFVRYAPSKPSQRSKMYSTRFSETAESIPQDILDKTPEELKELRSCPKIELIPNTEKVAYKMSCCEPEDNFSQTSKSTVNTAGSQDPSSGINSSPFITFNITQQRRFSEDTASPSNPCLIEDTQSNREPLPTLQLDTPQSSNIQMVNPGNSQHFKAELNKLPHVIVSVHTLDDEAET